jgi:hypothetical protein
MLLELRDLSLSLTSSQVTAARTDDHLVTYPNRPVFQIDLDSNGQVVAVRPLDRIHTTHLRRYKCSTGGLQESTPGFNIEPLFRAAQGEDEKAYGKDVAKFAKAMEKGSIPNSMERQQHLDQLNKRSQPNWQDRARTVDQCLKVASQVLLDRLAPLANQTPELAPIQELLRRSSLLGAGQFFEQVASQARQLIIDSPPGSQPAQLVQMLFAKPSAVVLELADASCFDYPANHERVWDAINRHLLGAVVTPNPADSLGRGIFGEPVLPGPEKMPERKLPRLGNVKLRSMTGDAACQTRYRMVEADACPVGKDLRAELAAALDWVTAPQRKQVTWADVSDSCGFDLRALLLAYPASLPPDPPQLSGFLAGPGRNTALAEHRFEAFAQTVIERLQGLARTDPRALIRVFVLAKADKARTKLLYSRQFTAGRVIAAAEEWQEAARNLPPLQIRRFTETRDQTCWRGPLTPFPAEVVRCLNTVWLKAGTEVKWVSGADIGAGLTLLLDTGPTLRTFAGQALRQALTNWTPLLLALGQANQLPGQVHKTGKDYDKHPLLLPAILGLLLAKIGSRKERYMWTNHYLIGRMLSLADQLHAAYCRGVRDGSYPPRLLGNSLMATALENPTTGLARLAERLLVYQGWASAAQGGQDIGLAKWLLGELARVENSIDKEILPARCSDAEKAQLLLGYLARPEKPKAVGGEDAKPGENP